MNTGFVYIDMTGHPSTANGEFKFKDDKIAEQLLTGKVAIITEKRAVSKSGTGKFFYSLLTSVASMISGYDGADSAFKKDANIYSTADRNLVLSVDEETGEVSVTVSNINL